MQIKAASAKFKKLSKMKNIDIKNLKIVSQINGKEATINRALDGSMYPG